MILRHLRRAIRILGVLLLLAALAFVTVNCFDQALDSRTLALLDRPRPAVAPADNLFYAVIGFVAAGQGPDFAFQTEGQRLRNLYVEAQAADPQPLRALVPEAQRLALVGDRGMLCAAPDRRAHDCYAWAIEQPVIARQMISDNAEWLRRYRALASYPQYANDLPASYYVALPEFDAVVTAHRLVLADIALRFADGEQGDALYALGRDLAFSRRLLVPAHGYLLEKMIGAASYIESLRLAGALLTTGAVAPTLYAQLANDLRPLTESERSARAAIENEFEYQRGFMELLQRGAMPSPVGDEASSARLLRRAKERILGLLLKHNASLNRASRNIEDAVALDAEPCSTPPRAPRSQPGFSFGELFYNPVGNFLFAIGEPDYRSYTDRLCDLVGLSRIVAAQLQIRERGLRDAEIASFLDGAGAELTDPYTDRPLANSAGGLSFEARSDRTRALLPWPI